MSPGFLHFGQDNKTEGQDMKINWKERVKADVKRQLSKKREYQKNLFIQKYNKSKVYEFPEASEIDMNRFFCFPKFCEDYYMSTSSIAIYPVLCLLSDFENNNWFQISQKNIAIMAGLTINTVAKGIKELEEQYLDEEPFLEKQKRTQGTRHFYVYRVNFIRKNDIEEWRSDYITFHKCIVESGVWADLKPRAKALYLSMRMSARFDPELYVEIEDLGLDTDSNEFWELHTDGNYRNRKWDVCYTSIAELCRKVNISSINLGMVLEQLKNHRLIERVDEHRSIFKVYLKPKIKA